MESAWYSSKFHKVIINITTTGYQKVLWNHVRCHKIIKTGRSIQNLYAKNHKLNNNKASAFLKKMSKERLVELYSACRRKAVWSYRKLTHADWYSSKCGVENWGNFEEHWAKADPENSISHLIYKADNLYTLTSISHWCFRQQNFFQFATLPCLIVGGVY